jgi:hypothetical protein
MKSKMLYEGQVMLSMKGYRKTVVLSAKTYGKHSGRSQRVCKKGVALSPWGYEKTNARSPRTCRCAEAWSQSVCWRAEVLSHRDFGRGESLEPR